ncbi:hypothetical protein [Photobacterium rosenbergii]|uniref:hypothetical protein n=1 Tax=Photobacterium rosenbergii TaxID=294936 RepID=UPI001C99E4B5|nr:hypothetical protein [Photobacterium rosenbergii]MBY5945131.1 hypothetical protein [Photobacterium rosenbergii]
MSFYGSLEKDNSINIYINDRLYNIDDKGQGKCEIILVDKSHSKSQQTNDEISSKRIITMDITPAWGMNINDLSISSLFELAKDIHLLADIYWIDKLKINDLSNNVQLSEILESIFHKRLQDELALDYY